LRDAGCSKFIVHARIAILEGLSPKDNRSVPQLNYGRVYQLKSEYPELTIVLNGGITTVEECEKHLEHVDGVMIGRQAYQQPWFLTELEQAFGSNADYVAPSRHDVVQRMLPYIERELGRGAELKQITRHMLGLFAGQMRTWPGQGSRCCMRRCEGCHKPHDDSRLKPSPPTLSIRAFLAGAD
jgi:tRNA-dihydrouridine synthase A